MKNLLNNRIARLVQLPTALLLLAVTAGFATVGRAEDISSMIITAERPAHCVSDRARRDELLGNEMRTEAQLAVRKTRISVATDLSVKLSNPQPALRIAGEIPDKRG